MHYAHAIGNFEFKLDNFKPRKDTKMEKVAIVGCGSYMDQGHGCPGEWRCLKAAAQGDGAFQNPSQVVAFIKCASAPWSASHFSKMK